MVDLVLEFEDIFIGLDGKVGFTNLVKYTIDIKGNAPIKVPGHIKSLAEKEHIAEEVKKLEREGQIRNLNPPGLHK